MTTPAESQTKKSDYFRYIQQAAELGWKEYPEVIEKWKKSIDPSVLWGIRRARTADISCRRTRLPLRGDKGAGVRGESSGPPRGFY